MVFPRMNPPSYAGMIRIRSRVPARRYARISAWLAPDTPGIWSCSVVVPYSIPAPFPLSRRAAHPAQLVQHGLEPAGQGTLHRDALPGAGVDEGEPPGVEALARQTGIGTLAPVHHVPQQGVADGGHVHPDLVSSG